MENSASLSYTGPDGEEHVYRLGDEVFRIGRLDENDLAFDNPYISRVHAEIRFSGGAFSLRDLDSTSGTFVNGERVTRRELNNGDRIRLGRGRGIELLFQSAGEATGAAADGADRALRPMRVFTPDNTRFINTARLPRTDDLTNETVDRLRALYEFTSDILTAHSYGELSDKLASFMHRVMKADRCAVLLRDPETGEFNLAASCPAGEEVLPSRSITRRVYEENVAILSLDASTDERFSTGDSIRFQSIRSVMCVPIGSKDKLWGVCYGDNLTAERAFNDEELEFIAAVARQAGLAMENLYLLEEQRRSLESFIRTLAASLDARDDSTAGHSARVGGLAASIARNMGLDASASRVIYYAGLLHDYGKIGIRDDVLLKPAELTPDEYETVKQHPLHTFRLLSKIRLPEDLADIPFVAAAHHERWDGSGYPHGLKGEEIPLGSRIVAVADAYDALTEERVYHEPWTPERALDEIVMRSGFYFDPKVVEAFVEYFNREIAPRSRRREAIRKSGE
jgi:HD-GYP domain-containing protein (c-di-GMP phosphodiesterase class II)